jgi:hypothetical protein
MAACAYRGAWNARTTGFAERVQGERVIVDLATYGADPDRVSFPTFKIDVVQSLLRDLGRVP